MARRLKVYPALRPGRLLPGMVKAKWDFFLLIAVVIPEELAPGISIST
jgi:hypothetical protein